MAISNLSNTSTTAAEPIAAQFAQAIKPETQAETLDKNKAQANTIRQPVAEAVQVSLTNQSESGGGNKAQVLSATVDKQLEAAKNLAEKNTAEKNSSEQPAENAALTKSLQQMSASASQLEALQARKLEFSTVEESGRTVIKVIDKENDDVIRQIPSEEFIQMAQKISDLSQELNSTQGLLFDSTV